MPAIQEYKKAIQFLPGMKKAAAPGDIFVFITTSSVPSLQVNGTYNVPPGCVVVTEENRMEAARIYLRSS